MSDAATASDVEWAAVCECGWAASTMGTSAGRHRIEQIGINHDRECDDAVTLERRGATTRAVRELAARWADD